MSLPTLWPPWLTPSAALAVLAAWGLSGILAGCEGCSKAKDDAATAAAAGPHPAATAATAAAIVETVSTEDVTVGKGAEAVNGKQLSVLYKGQLADGKVFDSSQDRHTPFVFVLGSGTVIAGWDQGLVGMRVGGVRRLVIPPPLGYGGRAFAGVIPPNSTLRFEVELVKVD